MIEHIKGDVLTSKADVVLHQVNCKGVMGAGLALQIKKKYPHVFSEYFHLCSHTPTDSTSLLGKVLFVPISSSQSIANLFAQDTFASYGVSICCLTQYEKLRECLREVNNVYKGKTVALPYKLGCGLAGGDWNKVKKIIEEELTDCKVEIWEK